MGRRGSTPRRNQAATASPISPRRTRRSSGEPATATPPESPKPLSKDPEPMPLVETDEERAKRLEIFSIMREKSDLPSIYGILEIAKEYFPKKRRNSLPKEDKTLFEQAEITVTYLMCKSLVDHISRPLSIGGMALSDAKAKEVAQKVFTEVGPAACMSNTISENKVMKKAGLTRGETRKIMFHLKQVGAETKSQLAAMKKEILPPAPVPAEPPSPSVTTTSTPSE